MIKVMFEKKKNLILFIFILGLCLVSKAWAIPSLKDITIPANLGIIKEFYNNQVPNSTKPTIIHIQDAHCNYEAQKNMAQLLEYFIKEQNVRLIMVEGGNGDVNLSFLRAYADKKVRAEVADKYLKQGEISGEEYLDIVSDYNIDLYGVEDQALYDAHMASFTKVDSFREEELKKVETLNSIVKALKFYVYNAPLKQLEEIRENYENKAITLVEYCRQLNDMANNVNLDEKERPNIIAFDKTALFEKNIDFTEAENQRNVFIKDLTALIDENTVKDLINKSQEFKSGKITSVEYYTFLKTIGGKKLNLESAYPQLNAYIDYITLSKEISTKDLLKEIDMVDNKIKEKLFSNENQKILSDISKSVSLLSRLLALEFTPEDYQYFQANEEKFLSTFWMDFLTQYCRNYNLPRPPVTSVIDNNLGTLKEFYQLGVKREENFIKNMITKMQESKEKIGVLITGGFHTPGITNMLKAEGYSYLVVTPAITQKGDSNVYLSILRAQNKPQQKAVETDEE